MIVGKTIMTYREALILVSSGDWAVATDGVQWMLCKRKKDGTWRPLSFVHSTKTVLAGCMREKGTPPKDMAVLLAALPDRFVEAAPAPVAAGYSDFDDGAVPIQRPS